MVKNIIIGCILLAIAAVVYAIYMTRKNSAADASGPSYVLDTLIKPTGTVIKKMPGTFRFPGT